MHDGRIRCTVVAPPLNKITIPVSPNCSPREVLRLLGIDANRGTTLIDGLRVEEKSLDSPLLAMMVPWQCTMYFVPTFHSIREFYKEENKRRKIIKHRIYDPSPYYPDGDEVHEFYLIRQIQE